MVKHMHEDLGSIPSTSIVCSSFSSPTPNLSQSDHALQSWIGYPNFIIKKQI